MTSMKFVKAYRGRYPDFAHLFAKLDLNDSTPPVQNRTDERASHAVFLVETAVSKAL